MSVRDKKERSEAPQMDGGWEIDKNAESGSCFNIIYVQSKAGLRQELFIFKYNNLVFFLDQ